MRNPADLPRGTATWPYLAMTRGSDTWQAGHIFGGHIFALGGTEASPSMSSSATETLQQQVFEDLLLLDPLTSHRL